MSLTGQQYPADQNAYTGIMLIPIAEREGVPRADGVPNVNRFLQFRGSFLGKGFVYLLYPNCRYHPDGPRVVFYVAYNETNRRAEYIVGPGQLQNFASNAPLYSTAAANFFIFTNNLSEYQLTSAMVGYRILKGDLIGGFWTLGSSWLDALKDPFWWMGAVTATAGAAVSMASRTRPIGLAIRRPNISRHPGGFHTSQGNALPRMPAGRIPQDPGAFLERGVYGQTTRRAYLVRAGPPGAYGDHLFDSLDDALAYARRVANTGEESIRRTSALPRIWPGGKEGNPVDAMRIWEVPPGTSYIQGVVGPQIEGGTVILRGNPVNPGVVYPGRGPQVVIPRGVRLHLIIQFPIRRP